MPKGPLIFSRGLVGARYKLDEQAESKLADILARYDDARRKEYLIEIERHLEVSNRPSAMAMLLLRKLGPLADAIFLMFDDIS